MISVSSAFLDEMYVNDRRSFIYNVGITLANGTVLTATNEEIVDGGLSIEESVSEDSKLQIGTAIVQKCTVALKNFDGAYDSYDFTDAKVNVSIGLNINGTVESFRRGSYIVDEQDFNNSLLTLTCLDYMTQFELPYTDSELAYPATLLEIVENACGVCGITMAYDDFPNSSLIIPVAPEMQGTTFRDVISWAAQCAGCNAQMDEYGQLVIKYYDLGCLNGLTNEVIESWTGEVELTAEDGVILSTESGEDIILDNGSLNVFKSLYDINVAYNDTTISGIRVCVNNLEATSAADAVLEYSSGTDTYELQIENNGLITAEIGQDVADFIGSALIGKSYRKASFSHLSDPMVMAGDVAVIYDGHGNTYRVLVSSTRFTSGNRQNTVSAGANPPRVLPQANRSRTVRATEDGSGRITQDGFIRSNGIVSVQPTRNLLRTMLRAATSTATGTSVQRYSEQTKQYIRAVKDILPQVESMGGLYETTVEASGGGYIHYLHNKPSLDNSNIQIIIYDDGVKFTANALDESPEWYGFRVNGDFIANILSAEGINANWINSGALVIYDDDNNEIFRADKTNKIFRWDMEYSAMNGSGVLTLTDDTQTIGEASLRVQSSDTYHNKKTEIYSDALSLYEFGKTQTTLWTNEWAWIDTSGDYGEPAVDLWPVLNLVPTDQSSGLMINNRTLEEWTYASHDYVLITQDSNLDSYVSVGNYRCDSGTVAATLTNPPFTDSSFSLLVFRMNMSANQCLQVAWQNKASGYLKYRIRHSSGSWGSWRQIASAEDSCPIGTVISSQAASSGTRAIPAGTSYTNLTSITLSAGTWAVTAHTSFNSAGDTKYRHVAIGTSASNSTYGSTQIAALAAGNTSIMTSRYVQLSSSTTLYLNVFSATACSAILSESIIEAVRLK